MISLSLLDAKLDHLMRVAEDLKQHFVGIDEIIDALVLHIQVWWCMPQILTRPVIVNLWGMTGVGKTDLVRRLVSGLGMQERFLEIELSATDETNRQRSIVRLLSANALNDSQPKILLFDEIQRFRTIDQDMKEVEGSRFTDFWELLSDGKLARKDKKDIDHLITSYLLKKKQAMRRASNPEAQSTDTDDYVGVWDIDALKDILGSAYSTNQLMDMTEHEILDLLMTLRAKKTIFEPVDHSQTLIIISGNLDEVYSIARQGHNADIDADIFHAQTKNISFVQIKQALHQRFRPEQIARFGNIHLIYPGLRRCDYERLIQKELTRLMQRLEKETGLTIRREKVLEQVVYRNGVFPAQGVRPVFSTIYDVVGRALAGLLFQALREGWSSLICSYDEVSQEFVAQSEDNELRYPFVGAIDRIKSDISPDQRACVSVHESGHVLLYALVTGCVPLQTTSIVSQKNIGGFVIPHRFTMTRSLLRGIVRVYLAGGLSETLLFGPDHQSAGWADDLRQCTELLASCVRQWGFDDVVAFFGLKGAAKLSLESTDNRIHSLMMSERDHTRDLLLQYRPCLEALTTLLYDQGTVDALALQTVLGQFDIQTRIVAEDEIIGPPYYEMLPFLSNR